MKMHARVIRGLLAFGAAALLFAPDARAQDPSAPAPVPPPATAPAAEPEIWTGLYFGGGGTYSNVSVQVGQSDCYYDCYWGDYYDYDQGDGDYGYSLHAGWRFHKYGALEVSYMEAGPIGWDQDLVYMPEFNDFYNNRVEYSTKVTEVTLMGVLPFGEMFEAYVKLGAAFSEAESVQRLDQSFGDEVVTRSVSDNGTDVVWGLGFGVTFAQVFHVRLGFESVGIDEDVLNTRNNTTLDSILVEGQFRFGGK